MMRWWSIGLIGLALASVQCSSDGASDGADAAPALDSSAPPVDGAPRIDSALPDANAGDANAGDANAADASADATATDATLDAGAPPVDSTLTCAPVGPAGGTITHPSRAQLIVPAGALATQTTLCITGIAARGDAPLAQGIEATPSGQTFLAPVDLVVPFDPTRLPNGATTANVGVRIAAEGSTDYAWVQTSADLAAGLAHIQTVHFTDFIPAVNPAPIAITTAAALPSGTIGVPYSIAFEAKGGTSPYAWSVAPNSPAPPGLVLGASGTLSGVPTTPGNYGFFVVATDAASHAVQMAVAMTVQTPTNPAPTLTQVSPASVTAGSPTTTLNLAGTGFVPGAIATFDGTALATTFVSAVKVTASVPATSLALAGAHQVSVTNPAPGGGTTAALAFTVAAVSQNPVPVLAAIAPSHVPVSTIDTQVTLTGQSFIGSSTAMLAGQTVPTTFVSPTQLLATLPASQLATPGTLSIAVATPAPGGGTSAPLSLIVDSTDAVPRLTALSPSSIDTGSPTFVLTLTGTGFVQGAKAFFGITALTTTVASDTTASATVDASLVSQSGSAQVTLVNPGANGKATQSLTFTIRPAVDASSDAADASDATIADASDASTQDAASSDGGIEWTLAMASATPTPRTELHNFAPLGDKLVLFGGGSNVPAGNSSGNPITSIVNDTWTFDGMTWASVTPTHWPAPRTGHAIASLGARIVLFGGLNDFATLGDTWEFDGADWTRRTPAHSPSARWGHAMVTFGGKVVLFGGSTDAGFVNDVWEWDGTDWTQRVATGAAGSPPARNAFVLTVYGSRVALFGGTSASGTALADTWEWDGAAWTSKTLATSPSARASASGFVLGDALYVFGGRLDPSTYSAETWRYDGATWTLVSLANSPSARDSAAAASLGGTAYVLSGNSASSANSYRAMDLWAAHAPGATIPDAGAAGGGDGGLVPTGVQANPAIVFDGENYLAAWKDTTRAAFYYARIAPDGTLLGQSQLTGSTADHIVIGYDGTNFLFVWDGLSAMSMSKTGVRSPVFSLGTGTLPHVAFDGLQFVVTYQNGGALKAARVSPAGVLLDTNGITISTIPAASNEVGALACDAAGCFIESELVTHPSANATVNELAAQRFDHDGNVGQPVDLNVTAAGSVALATDGSKYVVVDSSLGLMRTLSTAGVLSQTAQLTKFTHCSPKAAFDGASFEFLAPYSGGQPLFSAIVSPTGQILSGGQVLESPIGFGAFSFACASPGQCFAVWDVPSYATLSVVRYIYGSRIVAGEGENGPGVVISYD